MKAALRVRLEVTIALFVAALVGLLLVRLALINARAAESQSARQRAAIVSLQALVDVVKAAGENGDAVRSAVAQWLAANHHLRSIRVISTENRTLEATTIRSDLEEGDVPRRLVRAEKPLFDLGEKLRAAIETNREEKSARKEEIDVVVEENGGLLLAAPVEREQDVVGLVQVETQPPSGTSGVGVLSAIAAALLAVLFFVAAAFVLGEKRVPLAVAAILFLALTFIGYSRYAFRELTRQRDSSTGEVNAQIAANRAIAARVFAASGAGSAPTIDPKRWDVDLYRRPLVRTASQLPTLRRQIWGAASVSLLLLLFGITGLASRTAIAFHRHRVAYAYVTPALIGMLVLVFFPFFYGIALSFTGQTIYNTDKPLLEIWNGLQNYKEIIGDFHVMKHTATGWTVNYANFYYTLFFTIVWTISNVTIGVTVGLMLALILNTKGLAFRPIYRVLLILPWAVPNYITALIWRGMFHQQFGVINQVIQMAGGSPVAWFERPLTSFFAVLTTNGWLSFPFMMVTSLGALQSIPADLYEAARVDGASRWQQFRAITLPSLKPALIPAIILSVVWTFNMFNIIYLVSAGEPAGSTEILITQAYKIAFQQYRYGYAAAYSTVIFLILLAYGTWQNRVTRATEAIA